MQDMDLETATIRTLRSIRDFGKPDCADRALRLFLAGQTDNRRQRIQALEALAFRMIIEADERHASHVDDVYFAVTRRVRQLSDEAVAG